MKFQDPASRKKIPIDCVFDADDETAKGKRSRKPRGVQLRGPRALFSLVSMG
jgi:hypothetical protein